MEVVVQEYSTADGNLGWLLKYDIELQQKNKSK